MSMTNYISVFGTTRFGSERGQHDAESVQKFLEAHKPGALHKYYNLADPEGFEAHDAFATALQIPKADYEGILPNNDLVEDVKTVIGIDITRQVIAHDIGVSVCYFANSTNQK